MSDTTNEPLKTPAAWAAERNVKIVDPDGWRHDGADFEAPVTESEFERRLMRSTILGVN